jgi:carboxyl-terminal processing protease
MLQNALSLYLLLTVPAAGSNDAAAQASAARALQAIEVVLENHVDPPTRQELLFRGLRAIVREDAAGLSRALSDVPPGAATQALLAEKLNAARADQNVSFPQLEATFLTAAFAACPAARYVAASEFSVERQLQENRYVGIGIVLATHGNHPQMREVIHRGPAHVAGGRDGDLMISIDGDDASRMTLATVVTLLRGQEGKPVTIVVKQPESEETRTLNIVRGEVPFESVLGGQRLPNGDWDFQADDQGRIAYVNLTAIRGSSAHELKVVARTLQSAGFQALILDLRMRDGSGDLRHAAMIADELLGESTIGGAVQRGQRRTFTSTADCLFTGWPMVVLVDQETRGPAEWIAAALQDNERAVIVGQSTPGDGYIHESLALPGGDGVVLRTGILQRASGKPLVNSDALRQPAIPGLGASELPDETATQGVVPDKLVALDAGMEFAVELLREELASETR